MPANGPAEWPPDDRLQRASRIPERRDRADELRRTGSSAVADDDAGV